MKVDDKCVYSKRLFSIGMWTIADLFNNSVLIPFSVWLGRGANEADRLLWYALTEIVKRMINPNVTSQFPLQCGMKIGEQFITLDNLSQKHIKRKLADIKFQSLNLANLKHQKKYIEVMGVITVIDWENIYTLFRDLPVDNKTKDLQYRIVMRYIGTNYLLFKMKKVNSPNCSFCKIATETIEHLFFECIEVKNIWLFVFHRFKDLLGTDLVPSLQVCILGLYSNSQCFNSLVVKSFNTLILLVKSYIFSSKISESELSPSALLNFLKDRCAIYQKLNNSVLAPICTLL